MLKRSILAMFVAAWLLLPPARLFAAGEGHPQAESAAHDTAGEAAGARHAGEHETAPLLPSNGEEFTEYFMAPAIWTLVIFVIMLIILYPTAWKNVLAGLKAREQRIRSDIAEAEATRTRAEATLREYNSKLAAAEQRVRELITKATADGEQLATQIRSRAQQEAEETRERALRDIETAKTQAISEVHKEAAVLATKVAEKILRRTLNPDDQRDLVEQSLSQVRTIAKN